MPNKYRKFLLRRRFTAGQGTELRKICTNLSLVLLSTSFVILILELIARALVVTPWGKPEEYSKVQPRSYSQYSFVSDPVLGHVPSPNFVGRMTFVDEYDVTFHTNADGLRDREYEANPPSVKRILVVGDSFVWGTGVGQSEVFAKVLEQRLNGNEASSRYEVINAGVGGYSIDQYEIWLDRLRPKYAPDIVLLVLFVGNDFGKYPPRDSLPIYRWIQVKNGYRVRVRNKVDSWVRWNSALGFFVLGRMDRLEETIHKSFRGQENVEAIVATAEPYLDAIRYKTERARARIVVLIIPDKRQLHKELSRQKRINKEPVMVLSKGFERRRQLALKYLDSVGVPYLDLFPRFQKRPVQRLYYEIDGHFSPEGHAYVAELLEPWLLENILDN